MTSRSARWDAYAGAVLRIATPNGWVRVRPAPPACTRGAFPDPDGRTIHVITAHNPGGEVADAAANAAAQARLKAELNRCRITWWPAAGGDPAWTHVEPSVAVLGLAQDRARALGAAYGQEAIFALTRSERQILACRTSDRIATGWITEELPATLAEAREETLLPTRAGRLPAEFALRLGVGGASCLRHHQQALLADHVLGEPAGQPHRLLRPKRVGQGRKPLRDRGRVVVDDVVQPRGTVIESRDRRAGRIVDVHEGPHATAASDDG